MRKRPRLPLGGFRFSNGMKIAFKNLTATIIALLMVGLLAAFGNRQLSQGQTAASNFSAYPLPGTPSPKGLPPVATPTRAAYPLPATPTKAPTLIAPGPTITATVPAIGLPATATPTPRSAPILAPSGPPYTVYLPLIMKAPVFGCAPNTNGMGLKPYATYRSFALTDRLSLFVNTCNGNLVVQVSEFSIPSRGLPLTLFHSYNTLTGGWTHSLGSSLLFDFGGSAIWHDADGSEVLFLNNGGSFSPPVGIFDRLVQNVDQSFTLTHTDQSTHQFDAGGVLTQVQDRHGNAISLTYTNGVLTQAQAAGGQTLTFNYTAGSLSSLSDAAGHTVQLGYTGGALTSFSDPLTFATVLSYSTNLVTSITDPRGVQTAVNYDANNRVQSITVGGTQIVSFAYAISTTIFTDGDSHPLTYTLNSTGQVTRSVDALGGVTAKGYDANYNLTQRTDALGHTSRAGYDANGNVMTRTDGLNQLTTYTYNTTNDLLSLAAPLNHTTRYGYDTSGNLTVITDALGYLTTNGYDSFGQRTSFTDANGNPTAYAYSSTGYVLTTTDALSNKTVYNYDLVGNRIGLTDARGNTTTFGYDAANRLITTTAPLTVGVTALTQYAYDAVGNQTVITDARGYATRFAFDALNRQTAVTDALNHTAQSQYDAVGNRLLQIDANGNSSHFGYDALNRTIVVTDALANVAYSQYDLVGNRTVITDARGNATTLGYDVLNRLVSTTALLTGTQTALTQYQYDAVGNRTVITDANTHATTFSYDSDNRLLSATDALSNPASYGYDHVGNRVVVTDTAGNRSLCAYDALNRVVTTTNASGQTQIAVYDTVGNRIRATDELTRVTQYVYDAGNRLVAQTDPLTQTTAYIYDKLGNLTRLTGPKTGGITVTFDITYTYDAVSRPTAKQTLIGTTQYAYDNVGNSTVLTDTTGAYSMFGFDADYRMTKQEDHAVGRGLNVSTTLAYDANGNRTSEVEYRPGQTPRSTAYAYDKANRLATDTDPNGAATTYLYDAVGNRTSTIDPLGVTTVITPNALNLPAQTVRTQGSTLLDATTTTFDVRRQPQQARTVAGTLTLTTSHTYNANNYLAEVDNFDQGSSQNGAFSFTLSYNANNLLSDASGNYPTFYDSTNRVRCWYPADRATAIWQYYPDGNRQTQYTWPGSTGPNCPINENDPIPTGFSRAIATYAYAGQRLMSVVSGENSPIRTSNYSYDGSGNLTSDVNTDPNHQLTLTVQFGWTWQAGAYRMTSYTDTAGLTTTLDYDIKGRIVRRATVSGYSDYTYEDGTDWLVQEYWHQQVGNFAGQSCALVRYAYTNGVPARADVATYTDCNPGTETVYFQYNWHGDADARVLSSGDPHGYGTIYDPWGNLHGLENSIWGNPHYYYRWNGAWGYLYFADIGMTDMAGADNGKARLYYVHGRWYSGTLGRFLSPNEKGEYLYGSGDDAVNDAWAAPACSPDQTRENLTNSIGKATSSLFGIRDQVYDFGCGPTSVVGFGVEQYFNKAGPPIQMLAQGADTGIGMLPIFGSAYNLAQAGSGISPVRGSLSPNERSFLSAASSIGFLFDLNVALSPVARAGAGSVFRNYKVIGQTIKQENPLTCLSACGGIVSGDPGIQSQLIGILGKGSQAWGDWAREFNKLDNVGTWRGGDLIVGNETRKAAFDYLMRRQGPWIAILDTGRALKHAVVVDGFTANGALRILDPADGLAREVPVNDFLSYWFGTNAVWRVK